MKTKGRSRGRGKASGHEQASAAAPPDARPADAPADAGPAPARSDGHVIRGGGITRWDSFYRRLLPAYWIFLFCSTHLPRLKLDMPVRQADKIAHLVAYALLALLFWRFAETFRRPLSGRFVWIAAGVIAVYAAIDEWLQPFVGRNGDVIDWLYDVVGAVVVLGLLELRRRQPEWRPRPKVEQKVTRR